MRKDEAAKFLGISTRTLELYTQQGRIGGHYEKGKTRPVLIYDEDEVKRLQAELTGQTYTHRPVVERPAVEADATSRFNGVPAYSALSPTSFGDQSNHNGSNGNGQALVPAMPPQVEQLLSAMLAMRTPESPSSAAGVPIQHKLFLTLDEAQTFTGLSRGILRDAIKANQLPAKIIGRGWRIKRSDLEAYAQNMSMGA